MWFEAKLRSPIPSTFEVLVVRHQSGVVVEKNWALSVDQCWLKVLQFSGYLTDLLSILLKCNSFTRIQKDVDQSSSRPPNVDHDLFLVQVWLWEVLWSFLVV